MKFLSISEDDNREIERHLNSIYEDYERNPEDYIITKGKIIEEYDADDGLELNFYGSSEWIVEVQLSDGTVVETNVLRDEKEKVGDVIDIAYKNADIDSLVKYMNATQLRYIECFGVYKTIRILYRIVVAAIVVIIGFGIFSIIKK